MLYYINHLYKEYLQMYFGHVYICNSNDIDLS